MSLTSSASLTHPDYWWYQARADLLETVLAPYLGEGGRMLDVGSADGPSVSGLFRDSDRVSLDVDPQGLEPGGVCGSLLDLPFADATFDAVAAFDVIEHCSPEARATSELVRVLRPGGLVMVSVPAYQWAWTRFDELSQHYRRYTRRSAVAALEAQGLEVLRATYIFAGTFPAFAAQRLVAKARERREAPLPAGSSVVLPAVSPWQSAMLLAACRLDARLLRRMDLGFGSSVVLAARKPI